jgi:hypothetical protein
MRNFRGTLTPFLFKRHFPPRAVNGSRGFESGAVIALGGIRNAAGWAIGISDFGI